MMACALFISTHAFAATAGVRIYPLPTSGQTVVGDLEYRVLRYEDTLAAVAFEEGVAFAALRRANPDVDAWLPKSGTQVQLPTVFVLPDAPHEGIVINLSERRLYYYDRQNRQLHIYPVGIGRAEAPTPVAVTRTVSRIENPSWVPPPAIREEHRLLGNTLPGVVPSGPDNPLGSFAIQLALPGYFLHGTNRPVGVGGTVSHGCVRLYDNHIAALVKVVPNQTPVRILRQPYKVGWLNDELYLEVHTEKAAMLDHTPAMSAVVKATETANPARVDWSRVLQASRAGLGLPELISIPAQTSVPP